MQGHLSKCLSNERNDTAKQPDMIVKCTSSLYVAVVRSDTKEYSDTVADDSRENNAERTLSVLSAHSFDAASLRYLQKDRSGRDAWLDRDCIISDFSGDADAFVVDEAHHPVYSSEDITTFNDPVSRQPAVDYATTSYHSGVVDVQGFITHATSQTFATKEFAAYDGADITHSVFARVRQVAPPQCFE
ncbi:hypothetical protein FQA39_LY08208 [Lamprigera yunnana]|nr:hypothetical protein FQA39_LY08208 [Lamprigera yunnana]